ncbi:MAG: ATP synthase subunit C [Spirochaetaceae bacterium]|jgi:V/A-type H+-transporting ATPase subunit K|nr:ATP synthase subunit C [Spirochaetaceae bacterium]
MRGRFFLLVLALFALTLPLFALEAGEAEAAAVTDTAIWKYFAAALAVGISCVAGGIAVGQIGSAAMGAMSENPDLSGKALPYAGLAEGICLWGFLVALLILIF